MKIADTTVLIDHARGTEADAEYLANHGSETLVVSTISLQELAVGEVVARSESLAAILGHLDALDVCDHTPDHAYNAAVIEAELRGTVAYDPALAREILISAIARALSAPIVTRNPDPPPDLTAYPWTRIEPTNARPNLRGNPRSASRLGANRLGRSPYPVDKPRVG